MQWLSIVSDLSGLIAGLLFAIPVVHTQRVRDARDLLATATTTDPAAARMVSDAHAAYEGRVLRLEKRDYRIALLGAVLLATAFFLKLVATALPLIAL